MNVYELICIYFNEVKNRQKQLNFSKSKYRENCVSLSAFLFRPLLAGEYISFFDKLIITS